MVTLNMFREYAGACLEKKGFTIFCTMDESEFLSRLEENDVAWIISDDVAPAHSEFVTKIVEYNKRGHGVCFWADNAPWFATVNPILDSMFGVTIATSNTLTNG
jgi:hypothetical protein